jgi:uncharacterized tellurite resistance protein B-like protein
MPGFRPLLIGGSVILTAMIMMLVNMGGLPVYVLWGVVAIGIAIIARGFIHVYLHLSDDLRKDYEKRWGIDGLACFDAMVHMSVADGQLTRRERATIKDLTRRFFGDTAANKDIERLAKQVLDKGIRIESVLGRVKDELTAADKQMIIKASFMILQADGHADIAEQRLLKRIVTTLEIPPEELIRLTADFVNL